MPTRVVEQAMRQVPTQMTSPSEAGLTGIAPDSPSERPE